MRSLARLGTSLMTLVAVSVLVFAFANLMPGDPARILAGSMASTRDVEAIREQLGLNKPPLARYVHFVAGLYEPAYAMSYQTRRPVAVEIRERLPNTLIIAAGGLVVGLLFGIGAGVLSALNRGSMLDVVITVVTLAGISMPIYWLALLCIWLFAVSLGWLPAAGASTPAHFILPVLVVATRPAAMFSQLVSTSLSEVMSRDYLDLARSKGLSASRVMVRHALRNSLVAAVSVAGVQFGAMLGGAVVTETVFGIPGVGRLLVDAVSAADYPVIEYSILMFAVFFLVINLLTDGITKWLDPRTR
ncbi:ABC transporter permease [Caballeronia sp. LZ043]|uniref:ABC transporter permease n=1 Tax=Caballeronia sp. LZ043 TaxID=3038569 RepID=UPI0028668E01|nr:ABC transporter permease [Caballeronia sp. LZ043]MDR5822341.1 ABC transporter permease [Caballeronia sp. LZ043]